VIELPAMEDLGRGRQVLRQAPQLFIIGQDGAPTAGGDDLVAVETEGRNLPPIARMLSLVP
jgi:hypothetical protein